MKKIIDKKDILRNVFGLTGKETREQIDNMLVKLIQEDTYSSEISYERKENSNVCDNKE